jgi:histone H3/H4
MTEQQRRNRRLARKAGRLTIQSIDFALGSQAKANSGHPSYDRGAYLSLADSFTEDAVQYARWAARVVFASQQ